MTSASPVYTSRASTLPTKASADSFSSRCASRVSSFPLVASSPSTANRREALECRGHPGCTVHHSKLQQMLRPALSTGADVEQNRWLTLGRDRRGKRGPIDTRQRAERGMGCHDRRTRMTRAEESRGVTSGNHFGGYSDRTRGFRLKAQLATPPSRLRPPHREVSSAMGRRRDGARPPARALPGGRRYNAEIE